MLATLDNNMTTLQRLLRGGKVDVNYRDGVSSTILMLLRCILIYSLDTLIIFLPGDQDMYCKHCLNIIELIIRSEGIGIYSFIII